MEGTIKSVTNCPTCGGECDVNTKGVTHYYISKTADLQAELEKAKELIKELINAHVVNINESGEPKASLNELIELHKKSTAFLEAK